PRAVNAARLADVHELGRVLFEVGSVDSDRRPVGDRELAAGSERDVVLADLVALWEVGIEVVLAVEDRARSDLAAEGQRDHQPEVDGALVERRQGAGVAEADRARQGVRRRAERQPAAAEHLRARLELHVDLEADDRLVSRQPHPSSDPSAGLPAGGPYSSG